MIKTKCVYSPIEPRKDGLRILATRFRGRGLTTSRYHVWMANLGPSEALLKDILAGKTSWSEFSRRYRKELFEDGGVDTRSATIKNHGQKFTLRLLQELGRRGPVTLMCHCAEDEAHCHRHLLQKILLGKIWGFAVRTPAGIPARTEMRFQGFVHFSPPTGVLPPLPNTELHPRVTPILEQRRRH